MWELGVALSGNVDENCEHSRKITIFIENVIISETVNDRRNVIMGRNFRFYQQELPLPA